MPDTVPSSGTTSSDTSSSGIAQTGIAQTGTRTPDRCADRTTGAADKLWAALRARPGTTSEDLAAEAGIGRSTAAKILHRWVDDGTVERTPGPRQGKRTSASLFAITTPEPAPAAATAAGVPDDVTHPHKATDPDSSTDPYDSTNRHDTNGAKDNSDGGADETVTEDHTDTDTDTADADAGAGGDHDTVPVESAGAEGGTDGPTPATPARSVTARPSRLAAGALQGMVEDYLRDHPDGEFGPTQIGHALTRSSGAISNALERLVAGGNAVRTNDRPKRYRLAAASVDPTSPA